MTRYISAPISRQDVLFKWMSVTTCTRINQLGLTILKAEIAYLRVLDFFPWQEAQCCEADSRKGAK